MHNTLHSYIYNSIPIPFHYSSIEQAFPVFSFTFNTFLRKHHIFRVISKYIIYVKNFHNSESHENWYQGVLGHADHNSGISFVITIIFRFSILWPGSCTRIELEKVFSHFAT